MDHFYVVHSYIEHQNYFTGSFKREDLENWLAEMQEI